MLCYRDRTGLSTVIWGEAGLLSRPISSNDVLFALVVLQGSGTTRSRFIHPFLKIPSYPVLGDLPSRLGHGPGVADPARHLFQGRKVARGYRVAAPIMKPHKMLTINSKRTTACRLSKLLQ